MSVRRFGTEEYMMYEVMSIYGWKLGWGRMDGWKALEFVSLKVYLFTASLDSVF